MRGEKLSIHEALVKLTVLRKNGVNAHAQFMCEKCSKPNRLPLQAEGRSSIECGKCRHVNYLTGYYVSNLGF